ncbi:hypothetical protein ECANGB1_2110 [Enterospora canceri]|uniref:Uncharacterized protein n=1 Tax=Enterospora canceri TaxID=1081671 RepID=A0A1Y1S547_9MICR|nr:hypothetical protein ECANGB1_2110 [Enterospora canceri]
MILLILFSGIYVSRISRLDYSSDEEIEIPVKELMQVQRLMAKIEMEHVNKEKSKLLLKKLIEKRNNMLKFINVFNECFSSISKFMVHKKYMNILKESIPELKNVAVEISNKYSIQEAYRTILDDVYLNIHKYESRIKLKTKTINELETELRRLHRKIRRLTGK